MNIICFGDSITQAAGAAEIEQWPMLLQLKLEAASPGTYKVFNRGVGGDTTPQALRRIGEQVLPLLPGLVLVEFGINDRGNKDWIGVEWVSLKEYERNLAAISNSVQRKGGRTAFLVNHPLQSEPDHPVRDDLTLAVAEHPYDKAIRRVAKKLKAPLIDLPRLLRAQKVRARQLLCADGCHLSPEGNSHYAEAVFQGLKAILG